MSNWSLMIPYKYIHMREKCWNYFKEQKEKNFFIANFHTNYIFLFTLFFRYRIHRVNGTIRNLIQCFMFFCKHLYAYTWCSSSFTISHRKNEKINNFDNRPRHNATIHCHHLTMRLFDTTETHTNDLRTQLNRKWKSVPETGLSMKWTTGRNYFQLRKMRKEKETEKYEAIWTISVTSMAYVQCSMLIEVLLFIMNINWQNISKWFQRQPQLSIDIFFYIKCLWKQSDLANIYWTNSE